MRSELEKQLSDSAKSCIVIHEGNVISRDGRGVSPLLQLVSEYGNTLSGCEIADVVVGKAAASLMILLKARAVYGRVMSEPALKLLCENNVLAEYGKLVPLIRNRADTGTCPLEQAVYDAKTPQQALERINEFLQSVKK